MKVLEGSHTNWGRHAVPTATTIGVFDGVHLGHQSVLGALRTAPSAEQISVITFREHPAVDLRPREAPPILMSLGQRLEALEAAGVDLVAVLEFGDVRNMAPEAFALEIVSGVMSASYVAVGANFRFGHQMRGDEALLRDLGERLGFSVEVVDIKHDGSNAISSTAIRDALIRGDVVEAAAMLGRKFQLRGTVVEGDHRGRQIGFPTANLQTPSGRAIPQRGVYSSFTGVSGRTYPAVVNVGVRPTFGGDTEIVEVHLLDETMDLYGRQLRVDFVERIRRERRFEGIDDLADQIAKDVVVARSQLNAVP